MHRSGHSRNERHPPTLPPVLRFASVARASSGLAPAAVPTIGAQHLPRGSVDRAAWHAICKAHLCHAPRRLRLIAFQVFRLCRWRPPPLRLTYGYIAPLHRRYARASPMAPSGCNPTLTTLTRQPTVPSAPMPPVAIAPSGTRAPVTTRQQSHRALRLHLLVPLSLQSKSAPHQFQSSPHHRSPNRRATCRSRELDSSRSVPLPLWSTPSFVPLFGESLRSSYTARLPLPHGYGTTPIQLGLLPRPLSKPEAIRDPRLMRTISHYIQHCVVFLADASLAGHNGDCVAPAPRPPRATSPPQRPCIRYAHLTSVA